MKVQRYPYGRSNVSQLEAGRRAIRSPQEVAQETYAPYGAAAEVAGVAAGALAKYQEVKDKTINAEDKVNASRSIQQFEAEVKLLKKQIEDDPNATADDYETGVAELVKQFTARGETISDRNRAAYMEEVGAMSNMALQEAIIDGSIMRAEKSQKALTESVELALISENFDQARMLMDMGKEEGLYSESAVTKKKLEIDELETAKQKQDIVDETLAGYEDRIAAGDGDIVLGELLENPNDDPDVQKALIAGVKAQTKNYAVVNQRTEDAIEGQWRREVSDLITQIAETGNTVDLDALYNTMVGTKLNPTKAAILTNQVATAQRAEATKARQYADFETKIQNGIPLDNDKASRANVDLYLQSQLAANPDRPEIEVAIETFRSVGLVGEGWQNILKNSSDPATIATAAEFWSELHSDQYLEVEDGVSGERAGMYRMIERRAKDGGMGWQEATLHVQELRNMDEVTKEVRGIQFVEDNMAEQSDEDYKSLMNSEAYDKSWIPFAGGVENIDDDMNRQRYRLYYEDGFKQYGNREDAQTHANEVFKKVHVITNINGTREMQVGGIASKQPDGTSIDLDSLRGEFVEMNSDRQVMFTYSDGSTQRGTISTTDGLTFDDPKRELGAWVYKVRMNGNAIVDLETGEQLEAVIDNDDIYRLKRKWQEGLSDERHRQLQAETQAKILDLEERIMLGEARNIDVSREKQQLIAAEGLLMKREKARKTPQL